MSVADRLLAGETVEVTQLRTAFVRAVFGDRLGVTIALASLVWVGLTWRLGFFSNDQYTFANTVLAVADGHLHITDPVYGPASGATPGTYVADGRVYGRNYGIVLLSTVWYVALRVVALFADVRVLLTGVWSLALVAVASEVGSHFGRRRLGLLGGGAVAAALFGASLLVVQPLSTWWLPLVALQLTTAFSAAIATVICYRLVTRLYDRRLGVAAAVAVIAATPVGFWATLPKRHSVTVLLVACTMYTLYRSQAAETASTATRFRALTYVWPALLAWVHAPHGFILLVAVAVVDVPTARSNAPRDLLAVGVAFGLALLPFLLTNTVMSGNPIQPPRLLQSYGPGQSIESLGSEGGSSGGIGSEGGSSSSLLPAPVQTITGRFVSSYAVLLDPERLFRVFVWRGYVPSHLPAQDAAIHLSVVQSMPLLGSLAAVPLVYWRRFTKRVENFGGRRWSPVHVLDAFSVVYVILLLGLYLTSLPLYHMLTVRYLHPIYFIGVYWLVRIPAVRRVVATELRDLSRSYVATIVIGLPAYLAAIATFGLVLDESVQLYAHAAMAIAVGVGCWALLSAVHSRHDRLGAVVLGVAAGATTVYLLVAGVSLFPTTGEFLLPVSRAVSEQIHYAKLLGSSPPSW